MPTEGISVASDSVATDTPKRPRRRRGSINADDILDAAFSLAAETSLDSLTMPSLAAHLKVGVTSIYWYFRSKEYLLDAMTDRALERYSIGIPFISAASWDRSLREHARTMRRLFREDPVLCDLVIMRTTTYGASSNQVVMERFEAVLTTLIEVGFRPKDALDIYFSLAMHTRGLAMLERRQDMDREAGIQAPEMVDRDKLPTLTKLMKQGHTIGFVEEDTFEYGLDCFIEHAQKTLQKTQQAAITRRERRKK
ncbi:TetR/AcrR family transcriptional regulator [Nocardia noduli]|uniref:TetR/AcrR family transcriptional regulator n=1 Tax=Nocardia noduli TaxID=2815722 RepID=UPI001C22BC2D|nr:TetR/AcrR family transcriptional regulator [Nocardia noduli]